MVKKKEEKDTREQILIRVSPELKKAYKLISSHSGQSVTSIVNTAMTEYAMSTNTIAAVSSDPILSSSYQSAIAMLSGNSTEGTTNVHESS